ncbi:murein hydrolase activator EnvC family protein [Paenibacillus daejeonensis]|uniref:murein hydrolase activator EnvC family protein n=1 Tax=Paenibacillus daejeonensis TaxID=135193 RepID=UPI00037808F3|nr:M23 family metallopeptidase [Paenibacillus daejeonensis]
MKKALAALAFLLVAVVVLQPVGGQAASEVDRINQELNKVRSQMQEATSNKEQAEQEHDAVTMQKEETTKSINQILDEIDNVSLNLQNTQMQLVTTEGELLDAGRSLEDTEARIVERDKLLDSRVRLMYTNGFVSYMDVLMSATSFSDFLDRVDALSSIMNQDKDILEEHRKDKELILVKKAEIETKLDEVKDLYGRLENYHVQLLAKEKEKEVMILQYNDQLEELEGISDEQEALLMSLASKVSELEKERTAELERQRKEQERLREEERQRKLKQQQQQQQQQKQQQMQAQTRAESQYQDTGGRLLRPISSSYRMNSQFGPRIDPITGKRGRMHNGVDFAAPAGTPIYAAESGVVTVAQSTSGYGNTVIIDHGGGMWTLYAHIRNGGIKVKAGQQVKRGEKIAEVGSTGRSTGNHLHFEVRINEKPVNPVNYLR